MFDFNLRGNYFELFLITNLEYVYNSCFNNHIPRKNLFMDTSNQEKFKHKSDFYFTSEVRLRRKSVFLAYVA